MFTFNTDNKKVTVYPALAEDKSVVYLTTYNDDGGEVYDALKKLGCPDFTLVIVSGLNWEAELSPWAAGNLFKYSEMFTGGADEYLKTLTAHYAAGGSACAGAGFVARSGGVFAGWFVYGVCAVQNGFVQPRGEHERFAVVSAV